MNKGVCMSKTIQQSSAPSRACHAMATPPRVSYHARMKAYRVTNDACHGTLSPFYRVHVHACTHARTHACMHACTRVSTTPEDAPCSAPVPGSRGAADVAAMARAAGGRYARVRAVARAGRGEGRARRGVVRAQERSSACAGEERALMHGKWGTRGQGQIRELRFFSPCLASTARERCSQDMSACLVQSIHASRNLGDCIADVS